MYFCRLPSGIRDIKQHGTDRMSPHENGTAVRRSEEAAGHRSGTHQQPTVVLPRRTDKVRTITYGA